MSGCIVFVAQRFVAVFYALVVFWTLNYWEKYLTFRHLFLSLETACIWALTLRGFADEIIDPNLYQRLNAILDLFYRLQIYPLLIYHLKETK